MLTEICTCIHISYEWKCGLAGFYTSVQVSCIYTELVFGNNVDIFYKFNEILYHE